MGKNLTFQLAAEQKFPISSHFFNFFPPVFASSTIEFPFFFFFIKFITVHYDAGTQRLHQLVYIQCTTFVLLIRRNVYNISFIIIMIKYYVEKCRQSGKLIVHERQVNRFLYEKCSGKNYTNKCTRNLCVFIFRGCLEPNNRFYSLPHTLR